jgi:hypothetical protein
MELDGRLICVGQVQKEDVPEYEFIAQIVVVGNRMRELGRQTYIANNLIEDILTKVE